MEGGGLDPIEQARIAFNKEKYQIYSAMGYARYYPGLDSKLGDSLDGQFSSIPIPGTSDIVGSKSDQIFQDAKIAACCPQPSRERREHPNHPPSGSFASGSCELFAHRAPLYPFSLSPDR